MSFISDFQFGVDYVRGAEIEGMLDEQGKVIEEGMYSCNMKLIALQESDFPFGKADTLLSLIHSI